MDLMSDQMWRWGETKGLLPRQRALRGAFGEAEKNVISYPS